MSLELYNFTVEPEHDGMNARTYLRRVCGLTARSMTLLKSCGGITRGGVLLRSCDTVHSGERIELRLPDEVNDIQPIEGHLDVLYEDNYLLVVNKPPFMPVHPTKVHQTDTLANIVSFYQDEKGERYTFRALNRLDKDTSGCVLIAKDRLSYALTLPTVTKRYVAVCEGIIAQDGVIDAPIALETGSKIRRCVRPEGQPAVTKYTVLWTGRDYTLLELQLLTGRTHQIRCHMSSIGHPLAGDDLYGGSRRLIDRQALHCRELSFLHPRAKEPIRLQTEIPPEFLRIIEEY